ncbi:alpha/beta hydrolase [Elizabethkingia anophelis]|uniref:alpha/beta hydrolase n=1 Tax=Elizabethkingia anophelis TaxID=1117645 RepID=UPI001368FFDD|nr:alpha/beta hydrolase [Elizabethkingia anophelis]MYZ58438.1 alpha/beta hydrolase [Elizabethkingia anophelis]
MKRHQCIIYFNQIILLFIFVSFLSCSVKKKDGRNENEKNYIFFLHNKFIENNPPGTFDTIYNVKAEYNEIIESFRRDDFIVISERRMPKTDGINYAKKIVSQIDSLIAKGVSPDHITIVGTSKGGYIAQFVSTYAKNPKLNFVFIGCFQDSDINEIPGIVFCGNILNIYEKSDEYGVSAIKRYQISKLPIPHFKEVELNNGLKHGFLYIASDEWIKPCKMWAKRNYNLIN